MPLNMDALGRRIGPISKEYTWKDVIIYALGTGAGFSNLDYCYEKNLKVLPTFSIASIFEIMAEFAIQSGVNLTGVLHGEQELIFEQPIPVQGTLTTTGQLKNYYDKGKDKGALIICESDTSTADGLKLFTSILTIFARLDGGFGGPPAPRREVSFPSRVPDMVVRETPAANQPLLYRLSGDLFSLHADPDFARLAGFEQPIMHGLCTYGYACRNLVDCLIPGAPEKARRMFGRFSKSLYPGTPIDIQIWKTGEQEVVWRVVNADTGDVIIDMGEFEFQGSR